MSSFTLSNADLEGMGFSLKRLGRVTARAVKGAGKIVTSPKRLFRVSAAVATGGLSTLATKQGRREAVHLTRDVSHVALKDTRVVGHVAAQGARAVGHVVAEGSRVAERVARRIIMGLAHKILFKKGGMHGAADAPLFSRTQAKALLIPSATAAVGSQIPAAAPAVPVLVNSVIDELYRRVEAKIAKGLSQAEAKDKVGSEVEKEVKGGVSPVLLWGIGGATAVGLFLAFKPKEKK